MIAMFGSLLSVTLVLTPVILLILLVTPLLERRYATGGRYILWIFLMLGLVLPVTAFFVPKPVAIALPFPAAVWLGSAVEDAGGNRSGTVETANVGGYLEADTASGSAEMRSNTVTGDITVDTASGDVLLTDSTASNGNIEVSTASGGVTVSGSAADGYLIADTASGDISVTDCKASGYVEAYTASGSVDILSLSGSESVTVDGVSGSVNIRNSSFTSYDCITVSGKITIDLPDGVDDYNLTFETNTGDLAEDGNITTFSPARDDGYVEKNNGSNVSIEAETVSAALEINTR